MSAFYCLCPEEWYDVHSHFIDENSPGGSDGEESTCNVGDPGSIPGSGRSPEEGNSHPLQYFCLENSMDIGTWQATVHGVTKSQTQHFHPFHVSQSRTVRPRLSLTAISSWSVSPTYPRWRKELDTSEPQ